MYRYIHKTLDWGVKIASLAVTGPATWIVAGELFGDVANATLLFAMRFAAVFLIEGVLLSNWLLLEFDKKADPAIKARYGLTALAIYLALLVIGWRHEGPTGLVFRLALLAALIGSGWDTYVYTWQRATSRVDRSAGNAAKVRRHARRLAIREAMFRREAEHANTLAVIEAERDAAIERTGRYGKRMLEHVRIEDENERQRMLDAQDRLALPPGNSGPEGSHTNGNPRSKQRSGQSVPHTVRLPEWITNATFDDDISQSFSEQGITQGVIEAFTYDPSPKRSDLADSLGISSYQLKKKIDEMVDAGMLAKGEKRGQYVVVGTVDRSNH